MEQTPSLSTRSPELPSVQPLATNETLGRENNFEKGSDGFVERRESQPGEPALQAAPPTTTPVVATPLVNQADDTTVSAATSTSPTVAGDDDLIEKEWVDKAKKILVETKDDPYRREQEVNRLQADYISKRYGRQLGSPSER